MSSAASTWLVVTLYFGVTLWIGNWLGRGQTSLEDYFLAGRRMPWWIASLSIVATETSTLTFVGVPGIAYGGDFTFLQLVMGYVVGRLLVAMVLVPAYYAGRVQTAYELLADRFGPAVRQLASGVFMLSRVLADGVRLFATALVLIELLPIPLEAAIVVVISVTLWYTLRGGLRAVIWNDAAQLVIYIGGALVAASVLLARIPGGIGGVTRTLAASDKLQLFDLTYDWSSPYTFWAGLIGGAALTSATHGTDQMFVQRLLACGSRRSSQAALVVSGALVFLQMALFLVLGSLLYVFYELFPPSTGFDSHDQVFPRFIANEMPLVGGIVIAAVFAAAMSTLSSSLSALASTSALDVLFAARGKSCCSFGSGAEPPTAKQHRRELSSGERDAEELRTSRWITVAWAVALAVVALLARSVDSVLEVGLTITSVTFAGILGLFLLGLTRWRLTEGRAAAALAAGPLMLLMIHATGALAWTWYTTIGAATSFAVGALLRRRGSIR